MSSTRPMLSHLENPDELDGSSPKVVSRDGQRTTKQPQEATMTMSTTACNPLLRQLARFHGKKGAMGLFGLSLVFSFMTAFHFDLAGEDIVEVFLPTIHARDLLARKLSAATEKDPYAFASAEWEEAREEQQDYRECALYQPKRRPKHGCTTDLDTKVPYCQVQNLKIDWTKISGPIGGEPLEKVMGRDEDLELPKYNVGAFSTKEQLELDQDMNRDYWFYLLDVFMAMDITRRAPKCKTVLSGTSLLITRYEYVDMYHTLKDMWNAFLALPYGVTKVDRVIFLDAHAHGWLDQAWGDLFGKTMHVKELDEDTCLETAIFVPPGYSSVLWPLGRILEGHRCPAMAKAFVDFVVKGYGLESIKMQEKTVLIFDYVHHIIHPRSAPETQHRDNSLSLEMQAKLMDETEAISVQILDLYKLSFKSQLKLIRQAQILMGDQGEDGRNSHLAQVMFLQDGGSFIEIKQSGNDIQNIARWRPEIAYRSLYSSSQQTIIDYEIVPNIKDILTPGWDSNGVLRYPASYYEENEPYGFNETDFDGDFNMTDDEFGGEGEGFDNEMGDENPLTGWRETVAIENTEDFKQCSFNLPYPRPEHGCRVNEDSKTPYCQIQNLRIDVSKIDAPRGGEYVDTIMGRSEDSEIPKYQPGALTVEKDLDIPFNIDKSMFYYLADVTKAITTVSSGQPCAETITDPVLFVTRYEYVSLFHTMGDWWNAFFALPQDAKNVQVVFLDSHAEGFLDPAWKTIFGKYEYVKQLPEGGVCYKNAIFIPPGYSSVLWPRDRVFSSLPCPSMATAFSEHVLTAFGLQNEPVDQGRITIIDRVPFVSHPRRDPSQETAAIQNLDMLKSRLEQDTTATKVQIVDLEQTPFAEQLRIIRQSHILIGHHEAGLSELMFLNKGTHVFELDSSQLMADIARWKAGVTHRNFDGADGGELDEFFISNQLLPSVKYALERKDEEEAIVSTAR